MNIEFEQFQKAYANLDSQLTSLNDSKEIGLKDFDGVRKLFNNLLFQSKMIFDGFVQSCRKTMDSTTSYKQDINQLLSNDSVLHESSVVRVKEVVGDKIVDKVKNFEQCKTPEDSELRHRENNINQYADNIANICNKFVNQLQKMPKKTMENNNDCREMFSEVQNSLRQLNNEVKEMQVEITNNASYVQQYDKLVGIAKTERRYEDINTKFKREFQEREEQEQGMQKLYGVDAYNDSKQLLTGYLKNLLDANKSYYTIQDMKNIDKALDKFHSASVSLLGAENASCNNVVRVNENRSKIAQALDSDASLAQGISINLNTGFKVEKEYVKLKDYVEEVKPEQFYKERSDAYHKIKDNELALITGDKTRDRKYIQSIYEAIEKQDKIIKNSILATDNNNLFEEQMNKVSKAFDKAKEKMNNVKEETTMTTDKPKEINDKANEVVNNLAKEPVVKETKAKPNPVVVDKPKDRIGFDMARLQAVHLIEQLRGNGKDLVVDDIKNLVDKINVLDSQAGRAFAEKQESGRMARMLKREGGAVKRMLEENKELDAANQVTGLVKSRNKVNEITRNPYNFPISVNKKDKDKYNTLSHSIVGVLNNENLDKATKLTLVKDLINEKSNIVEKVKNDNLNNHHVIDAINNFNGVNPMQSNEYSMGIVNGRAKEDEFVQEKLRNTDNSDNEAIADLHQAIKDFNDDNKDAKAGVSASTDDGEPAKTPEQQREEALEKARNLALQYTEKDYDQNIQDFKAKRIAQLQGEQELRDKKDEKGQTMVDKYYDARYKAKWLFSAMFAIMLLVGVFAPLAMGPAVLICLGLGVYYNKVIIDYSNIKGKMIKTLKASHPDLYKKYGYNPTKFINHCLRENDRVLAGKTQDYKLADGVFKLDKAKQARLQEVQQMNQKELTDLALLYLTNECKHHDELAKQGKEVDEDEAINARNGLEELKELKEQLDREEQEREEREQEELEDKLNNDNSASAEVETVEQIEPTSNEQEQDNVAKDELNNEVSDQLMNVQQEQQLAEEEQQRIAEEEQQKAEEEEIKRQEEEARLKEEEARRQEEEARKLVEQQKLQEEREQEEEMERVRTFDK